MMYSQSSSFILYDETGVILQNGSCPTSSIEPTRALYESANLQRVSSEKRHFLLIEDSLQATSATHYVDIPTKEVVAKEEMLVSMSVENGIVELENLPIPCQITVDTTLYECNEGVASISFDYPGTHTIRVIAFPYLDCINEVTV